MSHKSGQVRLFVKTNASCLDPAIGVMLDEYLDQRLTERERQLVRSHLRCCVRCATYVSNSKAVRAAEGRSTRRNAHQGQ